MAEHYFALSRSEQRAALLQAASASGRPAQLLEKDIWVVRSLDTLFSAQAVATHKGWFFSEKDASGQRIDYNHAIQGELVLAPTEEARTALKEDYESMIEEGLFFDEPLPFPELMTRCKDLAHEINARMKP